MLSKYSPQTSQIQFLEEASIGLCVGAIPYGPHTLYRDKMTPPSPPLLESPSALYYTTLYYIIGTKDYLSSLKKDFDVQGV